ncbi:MAG: hypothetical protein E7430_02955 [Ruminococcaceae bacterium]|nr:hypothetical protein [Oscillospiraceae bacterium]
MKKNLVRLLCLITVLSLMAMPAMAEEPVPVEAPAGDYSTMLISEAPAGLSFTDAADITAVEAVEKLVEMGAIGGYEDGSFKPANTITREEMAKMLAIVVSQLDGEKISASKSTAFADVEGRWSQDYVEYCVAKGMIDGRSENKFDYSSDVTVTETEKMLLAYMGFTGLTGTRWQSTTNNYADLLDLRNGVVTANADPITREEAAIVICNAIQVLKDVDIESIIANLSGVAGSSGMGGGGGMPPPPPGGGGPVSFSYSPTVTELETKTYDDVVFGESTNATENAVRAKGDVAAVLNNPTVVKSAGDTGGDGASFYGINSAVMAADNSNVEINGGTVTTTANGANGVFSYGKATVTVKDLVVRTTKNGSGGIMAAGGGTLYAFNCDVETLGGSSAAIRSDRGGGTMRIDGGTYVSGGGGSPAIYVTADIEARNATLVAKMSQGVVIEGKNSVYIENCDLTGDVCAEGTTAADDDEKSNIMVMQSMSGDAAIGRSNFTMKGGKLTALSGNMFYTTNTSCDINIENVELVYANDVFLICACNENVRKWGTPGLNGSNCTFTATNQQMKGEIIYDTASTLKFNIFEGSNLEGFFTRRDKFQGGKGVTVTVDATSSWTVTADSVVNTLVIEEGAVVNASKMTVDGVETVIAPGTYNNVVLYK